MSSLGSGYFFPVSSLIPLPSSSFLETLELKQQRLSLVPSRNIKSSVPESLEVPKLSSSESKPMSKTNQYKKIMKPLLERKRRARINKSLDELKEIMRVALSGSGENICKLEKADILEMIVRHLTRIKEDVSCQSVSSQVEEISRFTSGYSSCANEAASFLLQTPGIESDVSTRLLTHLSSKSSNPILISAALSASQTLSLSKASKFQNEIRTTTTNNNNDSIGDEDDDDETSVWRPF